DLGSNKVPLEEFTIAFCDFLDGEFADYIVVDEKNSILASTRIVPKPIECKASDGATLRLQLISKEGTYELQGDGFKPKESLSIISQSEDEISMPVPFEASQEGKIFSVVLPRVLGKDFGHASLTFTRKDGSQLKLSYLWGIPEEKLAT